MFARHKFKFEIIPVWVIGDGNFDIFNDSRIYMHPYHSLVTLQPFAVASNFRTSR